MEPQPRRQRTCADCHKPLNSRAVRCLTCFRQRHPNRLVVRGDPLKVWENRRRAAMDDAAMDRWAKKGFVGG